MILERHKYQKTDNGWEIFKTWVLEYETYEYTVENVDMLSEKIRENLTSDLLSGKYKEDNVTNPLFGHCYHATQALYYLLDCDVLVPMSGKDELGNIHWWLQDGEAIIDVTGKQYDKIDCDPPYKVGKPSKWYGWKQRPHKRSMTLIKRVQPKARLYCVGKNHNTLF